MSTTAIQEALEHLRDNEAYGPGAQSIRTMAADALAEMGALRRACHLVVEAKALEDWESSMPTELADAIRLFQRVAKEST